LLGVTMTKEERTTIDHKHLCQECGQDKAYCQCK